MLPPEIRPINEIRESGLLWLINTALLHPRGFAIAFCYSEEDSDGKGEPIGWQLLGDGSEPWQFAEGQVTDEFQSVSQLLEAATLGGR